MIRQKTYPQLHLSTCDNWIFLDFTCNGFVFSDFELKWWPHQLMPFSRPWSAIRVNIIFMSQSSGITPTSVSLYPGLTSLTHGFAFQQSDGVSYGTETASNPPPASGQEPEPPVKPLPESGLLSTITPCTPMVSAARSACLKRVNQQPRNRYANRPRGPGGRSAKRPISTAGTW